MKVLGSLLLIFLAGCNLNSNSLDLVETSRESAVSLSVPTEQDDFSFVIFGDKTTEGGRADEILVQAVSETNLLRPVFVINIGDMISGYNNHSEWRKQAKDYRLIMDQLSMPWYPVAGNHDICWGGPNQPLRHHEADYEEVFGPLWYSFTYKDSTFIVLFSDEGNALTGEKGSDDPRLQKMSEQQLSWLESTLDASVSSSSIFLFLHHPRWMGNDAPYGRYGDSWSPVHNLLRKYKNVKAVFGGHLHKLRYDVHKDGIDYYTLGTTGGTNWKEFVNLEDHHVYLINVNGDDYQMAVLPLGKINNPKPVLEIE